MFCLLWFQVSRQQVWLQWQTKHNGGDRGGPLDLKRWHFKNPRTHNLSGLTVFSSLTLNTEHTGRSSAERNNERRWCLWASPRQKVSKTQITSQMRGNQDRHDKFWYFLSRELTSVPDLSRFHFLRELRLNNNKVRCCRFFSYTSLKCKSILILNLSDQRAQLSFPQLLPNWTLPPQ